MSGLIWVQTVSLSDGMIILKDFFKKSQFKKTHPAKAKKHMQNYLAFKELRPGL